MWLQDPTCPGPQSSELERLSLQKAEGLEIECWQVHMDTADQQGCLHSLLFAQKPPLSCLPEVCKWSEPMEAIARLRFSPAHIHRTGSGLSVWISVDPE